MLSLPHVDLGTALAAVSPDRSYSQWDHLLNPFTRVTDYTDEMPFGYLERVLGIPALHKAHLFNVSSPGQALNKLDLSCWLQGLVCGYLAEQALWQKPVEVRKQSKLAAVQIHVGERVVGESAWFGSAMSCVSCTAH